MNANYKILNTQWLCPNVGLVTIDDGYEIKTYCKAVAGFSEKADIEDVLNYGCRVYCVQLEAIIALHKRGQE
ncbi:MAG: hypothetical protein RSC05_14905 [Acinetobacter sp.]